ncbi:unnamed protein product [Microthlaspi erraticum]|uniref:Uncharacterized protein n=1 Tax=Microthlaspi erraticum TaxID=1685480 RepID=A0A6D2JHA3_9BRAS|nr:unnamed protein product [Microthlaspi erraticum]
MTSRTYMGEAGNNVDQVVAGPHNIALVIERKREEKRRKELVKEARNPSLPPAALNEIAVKAQKLKALKKKENRHASHHARKRPGAKP